MNLLESCKYGNLEEVKQLLANGANVNEKDSYSGASALEFASGEGYTEIVKLLLENGADVEAMDCNGNNSLLLASQNGHTEIVKILLEKNASVGVKNNKGLTDLTLASKNGHIEIAKMLFEKGTDAHAKRRKYGYCCTDLSLPTKQKHVVIPQQNNSSNHLPENLNSGKSTSKMTIGEILLIAFGIFWLFLLLLNIKLVLGALCAAAIAWAGWFMVMTIISK